MAFPTTPLLIVAGIAPGADPVDPAGWNFTDISSDIRAAGGVSIQVGRQDETTDVDATQVRAVVDNRSGNYNRTNPLGTWYGLLARGTPISVGVTRINDTFTRTTSPGWGTDADSGLAWTHNTTTPWSTNGSAGLCAHAAANSDAYAVVTNAGAPDVEVTNTASISAVTTGAAWVHASLLRYASSLNHYRFNTEFTTAGTIGCKIVKIVNGGATDLSAVVSTGVSYSAGTVIKTRARIVGNVLQMRAWLNSGSEPTTWTVEVEDDSLIAGRMVGLFEWRIAGNTNVGTLTVTIDNYRSDVIRAITPVPEWPVRWDQSGNDVTAPIVGAGVLRRLSQGQAALRSPIYRQLSGLTTLVQGYWPLEDSSDATVAASAVSGRPAATVVDGAFGSSDDHPAGAAAAVMLNTVGTSRILGLVPRWTIAQTGYAAMCYLRMPAAVGGATGIVFFEIAAAGTIVRWTIEINNTALTLRGYLSDGTESVSPGAITHGMDVTQWWAIQLETEESGGTVTWAMLWHQVGSTSFFPQTSTYAGTADRITSMTVRPPVAGTLFAHMWAGSDDLPFVNATFMAVSAGYAGETAAARIERLADEENVPLSVIGTAADSSPMGAQRPATLLDLCRECEDADQGILHERGAGLGYLCRTARYNGTAVMTLDFASGHVAAPPEPTDDDQQLRNSIKLSRVGGSEIVAQDDASIAVNGTYADELAVNLFADTQLDDQAGWRLHLGTYDELRWPRIELNLARNPSLINAWCQVRVGSRITIANPPDAVAGQDLDLIVEGWAETLSAFGWDVVVNCSPAKAWDVAVLDDDDFRLDTDDSVTAEALDATETGVDVTTTAPVWAATASAPWAVAVGGEVQTVTAVSGTGAAQTLTVTRSVNGISKTHSTGAPISLAYPARLAL